MAAPAAAASIKLRHHGPSPPYSSPSHHSSTPSFAIACHSRSKPRAGNASPASSSCRHRSRQIRVRTSPSRTATETLLQTVTAQSRIIVHGSSLTS